MNKRLPAVLLAGLLAGLASAPAWSGAGASIARETRQPKVTIVAGLPYSATQTMTRLQRQHDGSEFTRQLVSKLYRDSAGRTRTDRLDDEGNPVVSTIRDTDGAYLMLDHLHKTAFKPKVTRSPVPPRKRAGAGGSAPQALDQARAADAQPGPAVEPLGERELEGLTVTGQAYSYTAGGGDKGVTVVSETWVAPELKISVYYRHNDPRTGETVTALSGIDRTEPDAALFAVPTGYTPISLKDGEAPAERP
ncbi:hypothetical protein GJV26_19315 [Massilia dura]|uniref:DUF4412 domain-containing protein n=1 Tax=Pseudoduganella dura TaxID=321982 RepID=A0A6I3XLN1_9BURK|nr:hypothetical protein [Pseudoduganella dura]MUI14591.1 hypothetical protein [Pseudoduganella dura]GGY12209.1 hypothetical protein GCM10007386_48220 [Pseudoduganella dura]